MACDGLAATEKYGKPIKECLNYYRDRKNTEFRLFAREQNNKYVFLVNLFRLLKLKMI
jgi:hypothetical protein